MDSYSMFRRAAGVPARSEHVHTNIHVSFLGNRRRGKYRPIQVIVTSCRPCVSVWSGNCRDGFENVPPSSMTIANESEP